MFVVVVEFELQPDHFEDFKCRVLVQARDSLEKEEDCHVFDVCVESDRPNTVFLYEIYSSAEAFQLHLQSDHFTAFDAEVTPWLLSKQVRQLERLEP